MKNPSQRTPEEIAIQIAELEARYKEILTFDQAVHFFATYKVLLEEVKNSFKWLSQEAVAFSDRSVINADALVMEANDALDKSERHLAEKLMAENVLNHVQESAAKRATKAADARHNKPGGAREKKLQIQRIWASGKYSSRDRCAEEECAALGMSFATARKSLRNTPNPT
jgi:hypothetical protein